MSGATAEADDEDFAAGIVIVAVILFTILFDAAFCAFIYKVWNERQQTHEYRAMRIAQERIADAAERAYPRQSFTVISSGTMEGLWRVE